MDRWKDGKTIQRGGLADWGLRPDAPVTLSPRGFSLWTIDGGDLHRPGGPSFLAPDGRQEWWEEGTATRYLYPRRAG
jgi:hypothetical protein